MPGPYSDLDRPPLSQTGLRRALIRPGSLWSSIDVVAETGSTNADLAAAATAGAAHGTVLVAESQIAGAGRLDRVWIAPPRAGLTFSVLLRPQLPPARWGWLPLLAGLAVADVLTEVGELPARLKWPNDVLLGPARRKTAGILSRADGDALIIGIGLNVSTRVDELPDAATSLAVEGAACEDRDTLLRAILRSIGREYYRLLDADGDADAAGLRARYTARCDTVGSAVRVSLPGGSDLAGTATGVDADGRLLVDADDGEHAVAAGDVTHVRAGGPS